jgi:hypothetical protein
MIEEIRWIHRDKEFKEVFSLSVSMDTKLETKEMFIERMKIMWMTMQEAINNFGKLER